MSNVFSLDSLREEADKQFKPLSFPLSDGTEVTLKNVLRLTGKARETVLGAIDALNADDTGVSELAKQVETIIKGVASQPAKLLKELDGDLAVSIKLIEKWTAGTQLPEADSSPDSSTSTASSLSPISSTTTE
jgi:hypothetical protein